MLKDERWCEPAKIVRSDKRRHLQAISLNDVVDVRQDCNAKRMNHGVDRDQGLTVMSVKG